MDTRKLVLAASRRDAIAAGLAKYFTGRPCAAGHVAIRRTKSGVCVECGRAFQQQERVKLSNRQSAKRWAQENPVIVAARVNAWRESNPDRVRQHKSKWRLNNLSYVQEDARRRAREWRRKNPQKHAAEVMARLCYKKRAIPPWADLQEIEEFYLACPAGHHVDHIIPLKHPLVCGLHVIANLQYLPASDNCRKKNYFNPDNWRTGDE